MVLLPNAASSGTVYKINQIVAANVIGTSAVDTTVSIYSNGAVAQVLVLVGQEEQVQRQGSVGRMVVVALGLILGPQATAA